MVESSNTDVSSVILHLETLTTKYDQLLLKYKRAQAEYILFLKESPSKGQTTDPTRNFIRKTASNYKTATLLTNNRVDNINKCEAVCAANPLCTGATYSTKGSTCFTYGGAETKDVDNSNDGRVRAWAWETSILPAPTKKSMSENLTNLNDQLISLNDQILQAINANKPTYKSQLDEREVQKESITKNGEKLKKELDELKKIQEEHQELEEKNAESKIVLTQNHYIYIAVFIISLLILFILFKFVFGSSGGPVPSQVAPASGIY
uniref:Apple domain-containing protein n=1 Tax=viral metagenome TaxID=1070528 RepID=A0A6C0E788_9ZZZZ